MTPVFENQCNNFVFVLTRDPRLVTYKLGHNLVTAVLYLSWNRTKCEWVKRISDPAQHVVLHGFDGCANGGGRKSTTLTDA
jgi:hypothetical protein